MRLKSISLRGVTRFTSDAPVSVDFDGLGRGLIALTGPNGAGKTSLLESPVVCLYKTFPTRPGFYENFNGRDAFVEATWADDGQEIKTRLQVDVERRTAEQYLFLDGKTTTTGRSAEYAAEVEDRFGSLDLLLSSVFSCQSKRGNFLTATKGERKQLFAELLNLGRLEELHEQAKVNLAAAETDLAVDRRDVADLEAELSGLAAAASVLENAQFVASLSVVALEEKRQAEASAVAALERARGAEERLAGARAAVEAAERELAAAARALEDAQRLAPKAQSEAREKLRFVDARKAEEMEPRSRKRYTDAIAALDRRKDELEQLAGQAARIAHAEKELLSLTEEQQCLEDAERAFLDVKAKLQVARAEFAGAETAFKRAIETRAKDVERLRRQTGLLGQVPCTTEILWVGSEPGTGSRGENLAATCPLLAEARTAQGKLDALKAEETQPEEIAVNLAKDTFEEISIRVQQETEASGARQVRLVDVRKQANVFRQTVGMKASAESATAALGRLDGERQIANEQLARDLEESAAAAAQAKADRETIAEDLRVAIEAANERVRSAETVEDQALIHNARADGAMRKLGDLPDLDATLSALESARAERTATEVALRRADQDVATASARLEALRSKEGALETARQSVAEDETVVGDWRLLEQALGRDGIQALEIDAAGPEVARLTNELLEACYGPRFSISFETLREKKSAKGEYAEAFDVRVFDRGEVRQIESLSGGEKVVVGEAIGLALAIFNARKSGIRWETLWRDETAGALDPENAQAYVQMLRRALSLGGFENVIFVSHSPEVWQAADARVFVANGQLSYSQERRAA